jgi:hypothetical protein
LSARPPTFRETRHAREASAPVALSPRLGDERDDGRGHASGAAIIRLEIDRAHRPRRLIITDVVLVAITQAAICARAPAADAAMIEPRAGVTLTGAERDSGASEAEVDRPD